MPVEIACQCDEGHGYPHSHWKKTTVRPSNDVLGRRIEMYGEVYEQEGWTVCAVEEGIRYWGEEITVPTADLEQVLRSGFAHGPAADRLKDKLIEHVRTYPVPYTTTVHRAPKAGEGVTPCCGRTPFDLPASDRITNEDRLVTCQPQTPVHHEHDTTKGTDQQ